MGRRRSARPVVLSVPLDNTFLTGTVPVKSGAATQVGTSDTDASAARLARFARGGAARPREAVTIP